MITNKQLRYKLKELDKILLDKYAKKSKRERKKKKRDWRTYEEQYSERIKKCMKELEPLLKEASCNIRIANKRGKKFQLNVKQKTMLLLIKHLMGKTNRPMAGMLCLFSLLSEINVGYKTIERLYSDDEVELALHNLHMLIINKKKIKKISCCGDATGYSLTIRKHYASEVQKLKDKSKKQDERKKKKFFVYSFMLMDLKTKMYVCFGTSFKSEKEAFDKAYKMLQEIGIEIESIRLDKYYSCQIYVDKFSGSKVYIIPKKNATIRGSLNWKKALNELIEDTMNFLREYYQRENSESGIAKDKKMFGWKVGQKRHDRINRAINATTVWHNLFLL
ncbi:MAG: ISNCY family transposase [Nanoarchaeota archaeon]